MSSTSLSEALATLKAGTTIDQYVVAMKTMHTYCKNICEKPTGELPRKIVIVYYISGEPTSS